MNLTTSLPAGHHALHGARWSAYLVTCVRHEPVLSTAERIESPELRGREAWYVLYCDPTLPERVQLETSSG